MSSDLDFMVQPSAIFIKMNELGLVLSLLAKHVDPILISENVRQKCTGLYLTLEDIDAIKNGHFHVAGSDFSVRMMSSGNLFASDVASKFFVLLPKVCSLHFMRRHLEAVYGFSIADSDLLDLYDGAFRIAGRQFVDITTKDKSFVPRWDCSEAVWLFEKGCPGEFVSQYVWFRFHTHLPARELIHLALKGDEDMAEDDALLDAIINCTHRPLPLNPPSLKQTSRRSPPPPPIMTFPRLPLEDVDAVQLSGGTYTANSSVIWHHEDGEYTLFADFMCSPQLGGASISPDHSSRFDEPSPSTSEPNHRRPEGHPIACKPARAGFKHHSWPSAQGH